VQSSGGAVDRIRTVSLIGEGRHGQVFVGIDDVLRRRVLVKRIALGSFASAHTRTRLIDQARILSQLDHPNLLRIYDYNEKDDHDVFVIELAEGQPLAAALESGLDFAQKVRIATAVASALTVAHRHGVVHGALSPESVKISNGGEVKIVDFGSTSTTVDGPRGEDRWRSPEESQGHEPARPSDMYRFGLLLREMFGTSDRDVRALVAALVCAAPSDRFTAATTLDRLHVLGRRRARRFRIAAIALLAAVFTLGGTKFTLDLQRERAAAVTAQADAESLRASANELVGFMIDNLHPKLRSLGKLEIMDATSQKAFAYFDSIDPGEISPAEAAVNVRALTQFSVTQLLRNDVKASETAARKAIALADAVLRKHPDDLEILYARATAYARYTSAVKRGGDLAQAFVQATAVEAAYTDLVRRKPGEIRFLRGQAQAFGTLGSLYDLSGDTEKAFRTMDIAATRLRQVARVYDSDEALMDLFSADRFAAAALIRLGRFREARQRLESARAEMEPVFRRRPADKELLDIRAGFDDQLTSMALATGDLETARRYADAQLETSKQLVAFDAARFRWTRLLVLAHRSAGTVARMEGRHAEALRHHEAAIEAAGIVLARGSELPTLPRENASTRIELARSLLAVGRSRTAAMHAGLAVETLRTMPNDLARPLLADALLTHGEALAAEGHPEAAKDAWTQALQVIESLRTHPPDPRTIDTRVRVLLRLGRADRAKPLIEQLAALGYRNREFEALCREKGAMEPVN